MVGFVSFADAMRQLGVERHTFARRLRERGVPVYESPQDRRKRLIRAADLEELGRPQHVGRRSLRGVRHATS